MTRRSIAALALVALTAIAAASTPRAAAPRPRMLDARCVPGTAEQVTYNLIVNGQHQTSTVVKAGSWIRTDGGGKAKVCLQNGSVQCDVRPNSKIQVLPRNAPDVIMQAPPNRKVNVLCKADNTGKRKKLKLGGETITLGALGLTPSPRDRTFAAHSATGASGHLFAVRVSGNKTVMKVRRGATVVAPRSSIKNGVVLGRNQQVVASNGAAPAEPAPIQLSSSEKQSLDQLGRLLPQNEDTSPPTPVVIGPSKGSSLRSPTFRFMSNEKGSVFSCSLDSPNAFHVCVDGQPLGHLALGSHRLYVKATDAAGNTTKLAQHYDWSVKQNPIVFARGPAGGNTDIWVMDSDGTSQKQLTNDSAHARTPEWSPDHKLIAFDSDVTGNFDIYVMNADGSNRQNLTKDSVDERNPTWSPDGTEIAFELGPSGQRDIYVMSSNGGKARRLTSNNADDLDPTWSPDGKQIAFASTRNDNYDIWVINAEGGPATDLTNTPDATEFGPAWSPNGTQIAFQRKIDRPVPVPNDIYVMNADGSKVEKITQTGWDDDYPTWAPDGREIAFFSVHAKKSTDADIYFVSLDVGIETRLTSGPEYDYLPDW